MKRTAQFSRDRKYRYTLTIIWDSSKPLINFCMLNPSTADEVSNDPTVERCMRRATMWGYGGLIVTNIFAFRATDPRQMYLELLATRDSQSIVGMDNDGYIISSAMAAEATVCGWGQHGKLAGRGQYVRDLMDGLRIPLHYLRLTKDGQPCHPLYLPYTLTPLEWK